MDYLSNHKVDPRRLKFLSDPYRPRYHYLPPENWMNDPNGTIFWKGAYHLFYQHNPFGAHWGNINWGHAMSEDLIHWVDLPIALSPTPGGADAEGCFSGTTFINKDGVPTIVYYGNPYGVCLATSKDDMLINWDKFPQNPIIPHPLNGEEYEAFDSCAWLENGIYYLLTGGKLPRNSVLGIPSNAEDTAYLFRSTDLLHWEFQHTFYEGGEYTEGGEDCAVPDFFALENKHMLLFASHLRGAQYYIGTYKDNIFFPENHGRMTFGDTGRTGSFCEGLTLIDGKGRRILFGRVSEGLYNDTQKISGWSGILALPRVILLSDKEEVFVEPISELEVLRNEHYSERDINIESNSSIVISEIQGDCLEINITFIYNLAEEYGLKVCCSPDGNEQTQIRYNPRSKQLILDVTRSSTNLNVCNRESQITQLKLPDGQNLELRVFVDCSIVEVFTNEGQCVTKRIYPKQTNSKGIELFARDGNVKVSSIDIWRMNSIWS